MNIVCPPGDRRTQIIPWNIPAADTIITYQQCFIQRFHSMWIKKIDCLYPKGLRSTNFLSGG